LVEVGYAGVLNRTCRQAEPALSRQMCIGLKC
jgi:hypothetical protein